MMEAKTTNVRTAEFGSDNLQALLHPGIGRQVLRHIAVHIHMRQHNTARNGQCQRYQKQYVVDFRLHLLYYSVPNQRAKVLLFYYICKNKVHFA